MGMVLELLSFRNYLKLRIERKDYIEMPLCGRTSSLKAGT
jgi:hypothetical protein